MANGIFITGTDTGVGKTTIGAALISAMVAEGHSVRAVKPIESGCMAGVDGTLIPADALILQKASRFPNAPIEECNRYALVEPLAPAVAAERAGIDLDLAECIQFVRQAQEHADWVVVEGAGGLLVPFTGTQKTGYQTV